MTDATGPGPASIEQVEAGFTWEVSRTRWRAAEPDMHLTWGIEVGGHPFIEKASSYGVFGPAAAVLEVGPGYGRLLAAALDRGVEFGSWLGVDLSAHNVEHLGTTFRQANVRFVQDDIETLSLDAPVSSMISSLTFKHLFPSFENALRRVARLVRPGGVVAFDLIEGHGRLVEADGVTYVRSYGRGEVEEIVDRAGLELVAFDRVLHHPDHPTTARLLVVARTPSPRRRADGG
jgi:SAM-dependent methyltransferase